MQFILPGSCDIGELFGAPRSYMRLSYTPSSEYVLAFLKDGDNLAAFKKVDVETLPNNL